MRSEITMEQHQRISVFKGATRESSGQVISMVLGLLCFVKKKKNKVKAWYKKVPIQLVTKDSIS